jgi:hypothetical protein
VLTKLANEAKLDRQCRKKTEKNETWPKFCRKIANKKGRKQGGIKRPFLLTTTRKKQKLAEI